VARVLLVDSGECYVPELSRALERRGHTVTTRLQIDQLFVELGERATMFDIVLLDLSRDRKEDWKVLGQARRLLEMKAPAPLILCFSHIYRGPQMRLRAEKDGGRFVYAH
jgi:ActR/RegA family two-component response regulator